MSARSRNNSDNTIDSQSYDTDVSIEPDTQNNSSKPIRISTQKRRERDRPMKILDPSPVPDKGKYLLDLIIESHENPCNRIRKP